MTAPALRTARMVSKPMIDSTSLSTELVYSLNEKNRKEA